MSEPAAPTATASPAEQPDPQPGLDSFSYHNRIVAWFAWATIIWGVVGMVAGLFVALHLTGLGATWGPEWLNREWLGFGRLRPLHTNAVIFAFTGNAIFAGVYYSMQRLLKTSLWCPKLAKFHFWSWQTVIVAAAVTLPLGITSSKEYA
ncbi:MAG: cbb3-type cytochrome c oxidase subunit I, partial [Planctomycetota bacterium]